MKKEKGVSNRFKRPTLSFQKRCSFWIECFHSETAEGALTPLLKVSALDSSGQHSL